MNRRILFFVMAIVLLLPACSGKHTQPATTAATTAATTVPTTLPETAPNVPTTEPAASETEPVPEHSQLYLPGVTADDAVRYFNEVCLDAEFVNGGNASLLQRWAEPITYHIYGEPTQEDLQVFQRMVDWLGTVEGFPGMTPAVTPGLERLKIYFCDQEEMVGHLGENFASMDGGVTFWYDGANRIYDATICYRTDLDQQVRNSVILEEIYNSLGPVQDTQLRPDSLIWAEFSTPQWMTPVDELILKLLYHPSLSCGMDAAECEAVIRQLYYEKRKRAPVSASFQQKPAPFSSSIIFKFGFIEQSFDRGRRGGY